MVSSAPNHIGKILPGTMTRQIYYLQVEYIDDGSLAFVLFFFCTISSYIIRENHVSKNSGNVISSNYSDNVSIIMAFSTSLVWFSLGVP